MDDEYEILSHDKIEKLKKEADEYKNNPFIKNAGDEKFYESIVELTKSLNKMAAVFDDVKQKIVQEQQSNEGPDAKLDKLLSQNKSIAQALVSFGERLDTLSADSSVSDESEDIDEIKPPEEIEEPEDVKELEPETSQKISGAPDIPKYDVSSQEDLSAKNFSEVPPTASSEVPPNASSDVPPNALSSDESFSDNSSPEMDFQSWNYGEHSKPGVSHSNFSKTAPNRENLNNSPNNRSQSFNSSGQSAGFNQQSQQPQQFQQPQRGFDESDYFKRQSQQNFNQAQSNNSNFANQQQSFENISQPDFDKPIQQEQNFQQGFSGDDSSNDNFFQRGFDESIQNKKFDIQRKPEFNQTQRSDGMPELKPIKKEPPARKKRKFGLF